MKTEMTSTFLGLAILGCLISETVTLSVSMKDYVSEVKREPGHYPSDFCSITNVVFSHDKKKFLYESSENKHSKECKSVAGIWEMENGEKLYKKYKCDEIFDIGYAFTMYYWHKNSNYYHLHLDMMMPLYGHVYHKKNTSSYEGVKIAFMPTVESTRLKPVYWETDAFEHKDSYWYQSVEAIAGSHTLLPLDQKFIDKQNATCFKKIYFGTPKVDFFDTEFLSGFINYMKKFYHIKDMQEDFKYKIGLISRSNRRLILNEEKLIDYMEGKVDLIKFEKMTIKEQIQLMQEYEVLIGMNGAGLINAIYLPSHAVAVQLVPYKSGLNYGFYGDLLHHRGPYLEWHNEKENNTREHKGDKFRNIPDTVIDPDEFNHTVQVAMTYAHKDSFKNDKDEL